MSNLSQFFSGGGGSGFYNQRVYQASTTFTVPQDGDYLITAIGGGGGSENDPNANGSGAGGLAQSLVSLTAGTVLTLTIGAGGLRVSGGNTTVTGSGLTTLTANGGNQGTVAAGGAGGTASGGNVMNVTGGDGGTTFAFRTGGAVGINGFKQTGNRAALSSLGIGAPTFRLLNATGGYQQNRFWNGSSVQTASFSFPGETGGLFSGGLNGGDSGGFGGGSGGAGGGAGGTGGVIIEWFTQAA